MIDWPEIVRQHAPLVWRTAYRLLAHDADAADCLQETFVSATEVAKRQEVHHWGGLLQRLATVRAMDCLRRRMRERNHAMGRGDFDAVAAAEPGPLSAAQATELSAHLRLALAKLPPQQSEIFCLRQLNGLSYEEIAAELGISADAVGVTLHRARATLRQLLESFAPCECKPR